MPATPTVLADAETECFYFLRQNSSLTFLAKGEVVTKHGELGESTLIVNSGLLVVEVPYPDNRFVPTQFVPPGRGFAPSHAPDSPSVFRIWALADAQVMFVPIQVLLTACGRYPLFAQGMVSTLLQRTNDGYLGHARVNHMPLTLQVAFLFWWLALLQPTKPGEDRVMPWKIPQQVLADFFGVPREEVGRKLKLLESKGNLRKVKTGYALAATLPEIFGEYGKPATPVSFIRSVLTAKTITSPDIDASR
jgi:CRP-like cAMP-binding protein